MTITILVVRYDDVTDTATYRMVQDRNYGDANADMTSAEKNQIKNLIKRMVPVWKKRSPKTFFVNFAPASMPPAIPIMSQWTWDHTVVLVRRFFAWLGLLWKKLWRRK